MSRDRSERGPAHPRTRAHDPSPGPEAAPDFPVAAVRARFPALRLGRTVYLDNASGAQIPAGAQEALLDAVTRLQVNKGGRYPASREVSEAKERVRARTAAFLGAPADPEAVAFGANSTTLAFLLAQAVGDTLQGGDEVIVTGLDHHANRDPWRRLERRGVRVREWAPRGREATLEPADLAALLNERTRLVAVTAASNLLGTYTPLEAIGATVASHGARLVVDAVHAAPHRLPDVRAWRADAAFFSPYKVFAPHLGALWIDPDWRRELPHWGLSFMDEGVLRWEPGTQSHESILAFGGALDHLRWLGDTVPADGDGAPARSASRDEREAWGRAYRAAERHERALTRRLLDGLDALGARRFGLPGPDGRTATVAFVLPHLGPVETADALGERGIAVAAGHAYAAALARDHLGLPDGAVRASLMHYSNEEDVDALLAGLSELS